MGDKPAFLGGYGSQDIVRDNGGVLRGFHYALRCIIPVFAACVGYGILASKCEEDRVSDSPGIEKKIDEPIERR